MSNYLRLHQRVIDYSPADVAVTETTALFSVKAGTRVVAASIEPLINSATTTNSTMEVGDGTDTDGFITAANSDLETSTVGVALQGTGALLLASMGKLYTVDDTVDVVYTHATNGLTNPKVRIRIYTLREH